MNDASRLQTNPLASSLPPLWPPSPFTPSPSPSSNAFGTICNCAHNSTADSIHLIRIHVFVIPSLSSLADCRFFFLVRFDFSFIHSYLSFWKITFHSSVPYLHNLMETLCTQLLPPMYCLHQDYPLLFFVSHICQFQLFFTNFLFFVLFFLSLSVFLFSLIFCSFLHPYFVISWWQFLSFMRNMNLEATAFYCTMCTLQFQSMK